MWPISNIPLAAKLPVKFKTYAGSIDLLMRVQKHPFYAHQWSTYSTIYTAHAIPTIVKITRKLRMDKIVSKQWKPRLQQIEY